MAAKIVIEQAIKLSEKLWSANLAPRDAKLFGNAASIKGDTSILLLTSEPSFSDQNLSIAPTTAELVNLGNSSHLVIVGSYSNSNSHEDQPEEPEPRTIQIGSGDQKFIQSSPPMLMALAEAILQAIRSVYVGELQFYEKAKRFVESPDNFLAISPQSRKQNFAIYVRGLPSVFESVIKTLEPKKDRAGYSRFTLGRADQIPELMAILKLTKKKNC